MQLVNQIGIDTRWGFRSFSLYEGDLTRLDRPVDVVAFSIGGASYHPLPGTVVQALEDCCGLDVRALAQSPDLDLRDSFGCWVSPPLPDQAFSRLLCVSVPRATRRSGSEESLKAVIENLFTMLAVLETRRVPIRSVAMPLLGAGSQRIEPDRIMAPLLSQTLRFLERSSELSEILFVEIDPGRALALSEGMDKVLDRAKVVLPREEVVQNVRSELVQNLRDAEGTAGATAELFRELRRELLHDQVRPAVVGVLARRMTEFVAVSLGAPKRVPLIRQIDSLAEQGIASWIRGYMHVLRLFGNEAAHEHDRTGRRPSVPEGADFAICLFCLQRLLTFWIGQGEA